LARAKEGETKCTPLPSVDRTRASHTHADDSPSRTLPSPRVVVALFEIVERLLPKKEFKNEDSKKKKVEMGKDALNPKP
jgi:hypothetical protein